MRDSESLKTTIAAYDQRAAFFVAHNQGRNLERYLVGFTRHVPRGGLVLDVGCGPGWDSVAFMQRGFRAVALDLSRGMLDEAQKAGAQNLALADMRQLPITNYQCDGVWASASFLHVPRADADATLREFARVLKAGGVLCLSVKGGEGERFGNPLDGLPRYFVYWTEDDLDARLHTAGFEIVSAWTNAPEAQRETWVNRVVVKSPLSLHSLAPLGATSRERGRG